MLEEIKFILSAEDKASAKFAEMSNRVDKFGKTAKETGKLMGGFNQLIGATPFGGFVTSLTGSISTLIEANQKIKDLTGSAALLKLGMVGLAAYIGVEIGMAIGNFIKNLTKMDEKVDESLRKYERLMKSQGRYFDVELANELEDAGDIENLDERQAAYEGMNEKLKQQIKQQQALVEYDEKRLKSLEGQWIRKDTGLIDETKASLAAEKQKLEALERQQFQVEQLAGARERDKRLAEQTRKQEEEAEKIRIKNAKMASDLEEQQQRDHLATLAANQKADLARRKREKQEADDAAVREYERWEELWDKQQEKRKANKQKEDDAAVAAYERWEELHNKQLEKEKAKKDRLKELARQERLPTSNQAFESRMLSRGPSTDPINRVAMYTQKTSESAKRQEEHMKRMAKAMEKRNSEKTTQLVAIGD